MAGSLTLTSVKIANMPKNINRVPCRSFTIVKGHGHPCQKASVRLDTIVRWHKEGWLTAREASLLGAASRMCMWHAAKWLEAISPGAKVRIYGDNFKRWARSTVKGIAMMQAMHRAGLIKPRRPDRPTPDKQCTARSKRTGKRCQAWRSGGTPVCHWHGAGGAKAHLLTPAERAERKRRKAAKLDATLAKMEVRHRAKESGMLVPHIGFGKEPEPPLTLEQQFRPAPRPKLKPLY